RRTEALPRTHRISEPLTADHPRHPLGPLFSIPVALDVAPGRIRCPPGVLDRHLTMGIPSIRAVATLLDAERAVPRSHESALNLHRSVLATSEARHWYWTLLPADLHNN